MFDLNAKLETVYPEIEKAIGDDTTCYDLVHYHGIGTALKLNYLCMGVADYKFQCAGKDAQPFGKSKKKVEDEETTDETDEAKSDAADSGSEEKKVADGERRLQDDGKEEEEGEKEEGEEDDLTEDKSEGGFSEEEIKNRAVWEEEQKELENRGKREKIWRAPYVRDKAPILRMVSRIMVERIGQKEDLPRANN
jgi:hypothetical protein